MPHSLFARLLQKVFGETLQESHTEEASSSLSSVLTDPGLRASPSGQFPTSHNRRRFLRDTAFAAGGTLLIPSLLNPESSYPGSEPGRGCRPGPESSRAPEGSGPDDNDPNPANPCAPARKVVIVGAGMAGLNAAYQLKKQGIRASVYEASPRTGGRMFTMRDQFGPGITTDIGGEFVDTSHEDILRLVKELGLDLYDLRQDPLAPKAFYFQGKPLGEEELRQAIRPFVRQIEKDIHSLPEQISHYTAPAFERLDHQSILDYLHSIGMEGWLLAFLDVVLTREYGMEASEQSAINFLIMFDAPSPAQTDYELFGPEHEVFKIKGGSQRLADALYDQVKDQVQTNFKLDRIGQHKGGGYTLGFGEGSERSAVHADYLLLTIPFTILRNIRFEVPMPAGKRKCIDEIGYGNSCKFIMGMDQKPWRSAGKQGYSFTDLSYGCGWDSSQMQSESQGSFTVFGGGRFADHVKSTKEEELVAEFLPALDTIYKGAEKAYSKNSVKFCWGSHPFNKGGYSSFRKGQWSTLAGWEAVPVGNVFFAGEHVSRDFQGYMNGAAQTGSVAAAAIAARIRQQTKASGPSVSVSSAATSPGLISPEPVLPGFASPPAPKPPAPRKEARPVEEAAV